jgi:hypothetical protein
MVLAAVLSGCTLSSPDYVSPNVASGSPAFLRAMEAHTRSGLVEGNRVDVLLKGDEIFPAMLAAVPRSRKTIVFRTSFTKKGPSLGRWPPRWRSVAGPASSRDCGDLERQYDTR